MFNCIGNGIFIQLEISQRNVHEFEICCQNQISKYRASSPVDVKYGIAKVIFLACYSVKIPKNSNVVALVQF